MLVWLSPGFPVGAFSFSHGLEATAEGGSVRNRASLQDWICAVVASGSGRIDGDILRDAYRAAMADDIEALIFANQRGVAFRTTAEMAVETTAQGGAFLDTCRAASPLDRWAGALNGGSVCYAAAVGAATARAGIPVDCSCAGRRETSIHACSRTSRHRTRDHVLAPEGIRMWRASSIDGVRTFPDEQRRLESPFRHLRRRGRERTRFPHLWIKVCQAA
jgi:urease accessory protein UreF